jgi:hypothetical protein
MRVSRTSPELWLMLSEVPIYVDQLTGYQPTRQTVYNWVKRGWLKITDFPPKRTTRTWVKECLNAHLMGV